MKADRRDQVKFSSFVVSDEWRSRGRRSFSFAESLFIGYGSSTLSDNMMSLGVFMPACLTTGQPDDLIHPSKSHGFVHLGDLRPPG